MANKTKYYLSNCLRLSCHASLVRLSISWPLLLSSSRKASVKLRAWARWNQQAMEKLLERTSLDRQEAIHHLWLLVKKLKGVRAECRLLKVSHVWFDTRVWLWFFICLFCAFLFSLFACLFHSTLSSTTHKLHNFVSSSTWQFVVHVRRGEIRNRIFAPRWRCVSSIKLGGGMANFFKVAKRGHHNSSCNSLHQKRQLGTRQLARQQLSSCIFFWVLLTPCLLDFLAKNPFSGHFKVFQVEYCPN